MNKESQTTGHTILPVQHSNEARSTTINLEVKKFHNFRNG